MDSVDKEIRTIQKNLFLLGSVTGDIELSINQKKILEDFPEEKALFQSKIRNFDLFIM
jgi:hypothetical protein